MSSMTLNTIYNNYLTVHTPKALTKYDAHKRSELRSVCDSIVKINRDAPWYLPTTNQSTLQYVIDLKENAREMHHTIAQLGGLEEEDSLSKKRAFSSDEDIAAVSYIGSPDSSAATEEMQLTVQSLASAQENLGMFLSDEKVNLEPDTYSFDISVNDMNYEFQFVIEDSDTNRSIQEKLVRLINHSAVGIHADLAESDGKTALRLTSESSGIPQGRQDIFSVSDNHTSKTAGAVEYFGLDYISHPASNAEYLVNGQKYSSSSNHVTLGKLFEADLRGISDEGTSITLGLKTDLESFTDNVSHLISGYNEFLKAADAYRETQLKSRQLVSELKGIAGAYSGSLEALGVSFTQDGTLRFDQTLLQQNAAESDNIAETFEPLKNFTASLLRKSSQISIDPMNYVQKTIVAYKNPGHTFVSPYNTSAYSGMLFSSYC